MINRRKPILFTLLGGIVLLISAGISNSYAQKPIDFTGTWKTVMMINGSHSFSLTLVQTGDQATGVYSGNGRIEGTVSGRVLRFTWRSDRGTGSGRFVMDEKERAFSGTYNRGSNPDDVDSTWSGLRIVSPEWMPGHKNPVDKVPMPIPGKRTEGSPDPMGRMSEAELAEKEAEYQAAQKNAPAVFTGVWRASSGGQIQFPELLLQQVGDRITGRLFVSRPDVGVIKDGIVDHNILRFQVWRARPNFAARGVNAPEIYVGTGELVMNADGRSFTGTILGAATTGTLIARN
jgi:hypothetical protein